MATSKKPIAFKTRDPGIVVKVSEERRAGFVVNFVVDGRPAAACDYHTSDKVDAMMTAAKIARAVDAGGHDAGIRLANKLAFPTTGWR